MKQILKLIVPALLWANAAFAQDAVVGSVKDRAGFPLVGATIAIKGTNAYAVADTNGQFKISTRKSPPLTLVVSRRLGLKEVAVSELKNIPLAIVLVDDNLLSEVVITSRRRKKRLRMFRFRYRWSAANSSKRPGLST